MKIILIMDVVGTGRRGEVKEVAEGYAQNFLLPRKMAVLATPREIERLKMERSKDEAEKKIQEDLLHKNLEALSGVRVEMQVKASETGHLFAGIHKKEILEALHKQAHIELPESALQLDTMIKGVGEHKIQVLVGHKKGEFTLRVDGSLS